MLKIIGKKKCDICLDIRAIFSTNVALPHIIFDILIKNLNTKTVTSKTLTVLVFFLK